MQWRVPFCDKTICFNDAFKKLYFFQVSPSKFPWILSFSKAIYSQITHKLRIKFWNLDLASQKEIQIIFKSFSSYILFHLAKVGLEHKSYNRKYSLLFAKYNEYVRTRQKSYHDSLFKYCLRNDRPIDRSIFEGASSVDVPTSCRRNNTIRIAKQTFHLDEYRLSVNSDKLYV